MKLSPKALPWREAGRAGSPGARGFLPSAAAQGTRPIRGPPGSLFPLHLSFLGCQSDTRLPRFSPQVESPTINQIKGSNIFISPRTK